MAQNGPLDEVGDLWSQLDAPWRLAFDEAWASWISGNFGIGAVLVEPNTATIMSVGRNRVGESESRPRLLSGNMTAHAEMNAFAALDVFNADGLHLYTTLEPCLMCAATAIQLKLAHVNFAAADEFFVGMDELWAGHPVTAKRQPSSTGPFGGDRFRLGQFARLLPLLFTVENFPESATAVRLARSTHPGLVAIGKTPHVREALAYAKANGSVVDGLAAVWEHLPVSA